MNPDESIDTSWVFCFLDDALDELESIADSVDHAERDGRIARIDGEWSLGQP